MLDPLAAARRLLPELDRLGEDGALVAGGLSRWLDGEDFDQALGLYGDWRGDDRRRRRDDLIRDLARCFPGSRWARAEAIAEELRRYQATGWRHDRRHGSITGPKHRRLMHRILTVDSDAPTGARRLFDLLQCEGLAVAETSAAEVVATPQDEDRDEPDFAA